MAGVAAYRRVLDAIINLFRSDAAAAFSTTQVPTHGDEAERAAAREVLQDAYRQGMQRAVTRGRHLAWAAAALYLEDEARSQAGTSAYLPAEPGYAPEWLDEAIREADGAPLSVEHHQNVVTTLTRHVEAAARSTVEAAVDTDLDNGPVQDEPLTRSERRALEAKAKAKAAEQAEDEEHQAEARKVHDARMEEARKALAGTGLDLSDWNVSASGKVLTQPVGWARMLNPLKGNHCGLCVVCAARGPVYSSRETALTRDGTDAHRYHDNCTCIVVPVYTSARWPGRAAHERLEQAYKEHVTDKGLSGAAARTEMDKWSRGDRTAEKSLARRRRKWEETLSDEDRALLARQRALASDMSDLQHEDGSIEILHEHEIDFLEAFEAAGHRVKWIPKGKHDPVTGTPPSNDFIWLTHGNVATELKNPPAKYSSIASRIDDAVTGARKHAVPAVKDTFVIHLDYPMRENLERQLRKYNVRRPDAAIKEMWVFEKQTRKLTQIDLLEK